VNPRPTRWHSALTVGVLNAVRTGRLLRAGERVGVAVSGGADSVALLRLLLELRTELGIVPAVVHMNHGIRAEAAADAAFVAALAREHDLELFAETADATGFAASRRLSLEAAGRELRYGFFARLVAEGKLDRIATAHTLDDQAETVLLRLIRGAGTRGLAGILPARGAAPQRLKQQQVGPSHGAAEAAPLRNRVGCPKSANHIVRPLLAVRRADLERYLRQIGQPWHEDASNRDRRFLRNRVRHELLPLLEREFNPSVVRVLGEMAEAARGEEEYWSEQVERALTESCSPAAPERAAARAPVVRLESFRRLPPALQRRVVRALAERVGLRLDFEHVEQVLSLAESQSGKRERKVELRGGLVVVAGAAELRFELDKRSLPEKRANALARR